MKLRMYVLLMLFPTLAAFGQTSSDEEFRGQAIPTGVAFRHAVSSYRYEVENGDGSNELVEEIQNRFNVDFDAADDLLVLFLEAAIAIDADSHTIISALACLGGDPYEFLDQKYYVNEVVGLIQFEKLKMRLNKVAAWKLDDWISDLKERMVYIRMDQEAAYKQSDLDASAEMADMCPVANKDVVE